MNLLFIYFDCAWPRSRIPVNPTEYQLSPTRIYRTRRLRGMYSPRWKKVHCTCFIVFLPFAYSPHRQRLSYSSYSSPILRFTIPFNCVHFNVFFNTTDLRFK